MVGKRWAGVGMLAVLIAVVASVFAPNAMAQIPPPDGPSPEVTAIQVKAIGRPQFVFGSDGRTHVEYDLVVTNAFTAEVTLRSLTVRADGRTLLTLTGQALAEHTVTLLAAKPSAEIPPSAARLVLLDVVLPQSDGRHAPEQLSNRIHYSIPDNAPFRAAIGSTTVDGPVLSSSRRPPVRISSPVQGSGWVAAQGCCEDPTSPHRTAVLSANGTYVDAELFDIDWLQEVDGSLYHGDGKQLDDYPSFGAPIYAVADGSIVSTISDRPEVPPTETNPNVRTPDDFGGNEIVEKLGSGVYAFYAHLQTDSVMVRPGQVVHTGQMIARLGNTGNTTAPHLHFGIHDGPRPLASNSLPFEIDDYTLQGSVSPASTPTHLVIGGPSGPQQRSYPLIGSVFAFPAVPPLTGEAH
jgi:hypothetical protein